MQRNDGSKASHTRQMNLRLSHGVPMGLRVSHVTVQTQVELKNRAEFEC